MCGWLRGCFKGFGTLLGPNQSLSSLQLPHISRIFLPFVLVPPVYSLVALHLSGLNDFFIHPFHLLCLVYGLLKLPEVRKETAIGHGSKKK